MQLTLPDFSLVLLIGASGAGKSTFAAEHFLPTEVISSDHCRGLVTDDENALDANQDAFEVLHFLARKRLQRRRLTVIDATNVQPEARKPLLQLAREHHCLAVAIVFELPDKVCLEHNERRPDRQLPARVIRAHGRTLRRSLRGLKQEGFQRIFRLRSDEEVTAATLERQPLWNDRRDLAGPFDVIGDIHGCLGELVTLLETLGWAVQRDEAGRPMGARPPEGRTAIFLGDLVDRGPETPGVLRLVMAMVAAGHALCVPGNHDVKLLKWLDGKKVKIAHGLEESISQLEAEPEAFRDQVREFLRSLVSHFVLDDGRLVVAHAGMPEAMQGRASGKVRAFALYGETTGEIDSFGLPVRYAWAADYDGRAAVLYGHTPVEHPHWLNNTLCLDTGCVFGGRLTALRYPERELVSVPAAETYCEPVRPLPAPEPEAGSDLLDIADFQGKQTLETRLFGPVAIREGQSTAALEVLSRFGADPRWLIYLPPTMSPCSTCTEGDLLEDPSRVFADFRKMGARHLVCEEKHMGSRAVVVLCRTPEAAVRRFDVDPERDGLGACLTRTGRLFFSDPELHAAFLDRLRAVLEEAGTWDRLETDWLALDCELMPWSAKAVDLLRTQYAAIGAAGRHLLDPAMRALELAAGRGVDGLDELHTRHLQRRRGVEGLVAAYRRYCWPVEGLEGLRLAPFHVLASEGRTHTDRDHLWHLEEIRRWVEIGDALLQSTQVREVDLEEANSRDGATAWWHELTEAGGEGMVAKPLDFVTRNGHRPVQPAIKCRGREYLRIIYGPEYTLPENLDRLRKRGLARKRALALREFALGLEALDAFVGGRGLRAVHRCVAGVLALESEDVDPRL